MPWADAARRAAKRRSQQAARSAGRCVANGAVAVLAAGTVSSAPRPDVIHKPSGGASDQGDCSP